MIYVGVDPGKTGGVAVVSEDEKRITLYDTPVLSIAGTSQGKDVERNAIDEDGMWDLVSLIQQVANGEPIQVIIEHAQSMPKNGSVAMFNYGYTFGVMVMAFAGHKISRTLIKPRVWKARMKLTKQTKQASIALAKQLYPQASGQIGHKDGRAEALLIVHYHRYLAGTLGTAPQAKTHNPALTLPAPGMFADEDEIIASMNKWR